MAGSLFWWFDYFVFFIGVTAVIYALFALKSREIMLFLPNFYLKRDSHSPWDWLLYWYLVLLFFLGGIVVMIVGLYLIFLNNEIIWLFFSSDYYVTLHRWMSISFLRNDILFHRNSLPLIFWNDNHIHSFLVPVSFRRWAVPFMKLESSWLFGPFW